ncbi:MAG TPA: TetR/AcrR family transcriptional regulator [Flavobacteriales bacterium]|nr:TetR/AcrR family transcriptional regulator [Flavobacteriales bacterium]
MVALKTFKNLPQERQDEIIAVCLREFAVNGYQHASLGNIIAELEIAKGSFYRYFENKKSLYLFLLDHCAEIRLQHDSKMVPDPSGNYFDRMLQHFKGKIKFDKDHPLASAFLHTVLEEKNNDEISDIQFRSKEKILKLIRPLVAQQVKDKKLRKDIDQDLVSYMSLQMNLSILDYIAHKHKIDYRENIKKGKPLYGISEKEMLKAGKEFMEIFRRGIAVI